MINKKISIITVVKNGMPYLKNSIKSFKLQNYNNKELIIVYSKSNDETESFLNDIKDENIFIKKAETSENRLLFSCSKRFCSCNPHYQRPRIVHYRH